MNMRAYDPKHDAAFDPRTGKWLERQCGDPRCQFCVNRPHRKKLSLRYKLMAWLIWLFERGK